MNVITPDAPSRLAAAQPLVPAVAQQSLEFLLLDGDAAVVRQGIHDEESHVVAGQAVRVARVSQAGNDLHDRSATAKGLWLMAKGKTKENESSPEILALCLKPFALCPK